MRPELTLIVTIALLFLFDLFAPERLRRYFHPLTCVLLTVQILVNIVPQPDPVQLFGGMYPVSYTHPTVPMAPAAPGLSLVPASPSTRKLNSGNTRIRMVKSIVDAF